MMPPPAASSLGPRLSEVEQKLAVHEAVCAERYKALDLKLMVILGVQGAILVMLAGGTPVANAIRSVFGAGS